MESKNVDIQILCKIARDAGLETLKYFKKIEDTDINIKSDETPVTVADFAANRVIVDSLREFFPGIPALSEESKKSDFVERFKWNRYFLIDPIDGTKEFIKGSSEYTINIALIEDCESILGVVYQPVGDVLYYGNIKESYRECAGQKLRLPIEPFIEGKLRVVSSKSHKNKETTEYIEKLKNDYEVESLCFGSSLKLCKIAEGLADLNPRLGGTSEWDIAAGHAVIRGSGGDIVLMGSSKRVQYNKRDLLNPWYEAMRSELLEDQKFFTLQK